MKQDRVAFFIDGSNLYHKLKDRELALSKLITYDYAGLCEEIADGRTIVMKSYYIGSIKINTKKSPEEIKKTEQLRKNQNILFGHLESKKQKFSIKRGYLMENEGVYKEKGVDVEIAIDIVTGAYEDLYDTAIILSSDTDLIPAIRAARSKGKSVEYIGFAHNPSRGMTRNVDRALFLEKEQLQKYGS